MKQVICDHCGKVLSPNGKIDYCIEGNMYTGKELQLRPLEECWVDYAIRPMTATNEGEARQLCWNCMKELQRTINEYCGYYEGGEYNASRES